MMRYTPLCIGVLIALTLTSGAMAGDLETHSVYKVTTYNLGALLGDQGSAGISMQNYEPLLITNTTADILNEHPINTDHLNGTSSINRAQGFAIAAEYNASPQFAVQGVLGVTQNGKTPSALEDKSSWEANLGLIYRLLDNLSYEVHFGYMETGDLFRERSSYSDVESIIMVSNKLTMSF